MTSDSIQALDYSPAALFSAEVRAEPYGFYRWARKEAPVCPGGPMGAYLVSRYADVAYILRDVSGFSSSIMAPADPVLLGADPPAHHRVRDAVARALGVARTTATETMLRNRARELIEEMVRARTADIIADFATPLPIFAIATLLGLPTDRHADLRRWADAVVASSTGMPTADVTAQLRDMGNFLGALIAERSEPHWNEHEDFISALLRGSSPLSAQEAVAVVSLIIVAGSETTTHLIGNAVLALASCPVELNRLRADPTRLPGVVDEVLRFESPVQVIQRRCTTAMVLSGVQIPEGAPVLLLLGSANRDEAQFANPDDFRPTRGVSHLAFGVGPHACVGATLARLQTVIALEALLLRVPEFTVLPDASRPLTQAVQLRGHARMLAAFPER